MLTEFFVLFSGYMNGVRAMLQLTMPSGEQLLPHTLYVLEPLMFIYVQTNLLTCVSHTLSFEQTKRTEKIKRL